LRDPLIAKVFYLAGYIEQYGSGTVRMVEWMKEAGLPELEERGPSDAIKLAENFPKAISFVALAGGA
jgi:predicted HTH transcriptional regulator